MRIEPLNTNYDQIASIYNSHFGQVSIQKFLPILNRMFLGKLPPGSKILDLCCGAGQIAAVASTKKFEVTGIDISENMVKYAEVNAPSVDFRVGDIKNLTLSEKYSGIYSMFNGLNNVFDLKTMQGLFETIYSSLEENGLFFFDVDDETGFMNKWKGSLRIESPTGYYFVKMIYDKVSNLGKSYITVVSETERPAYAEVEISAKCFSTLEIKSALRNAGFESVASYDAQKDLGIANEEGRVFFICRR